MSEKQNKQNETPPTIITLTLPTPEGGGLSLERATATIDIPLKKGVKTVKMSHLKIIGGETDAAAYRQAVLIAGKLITADLQRHDDERFRQTGWLMHWLFSSSGNSSVDYDYETMREFQPLSWEADDLAFAIEIIEEANGIMADALAGLAFLTSQLELMKALQHNVRRIYKAIDRQKGKQDEPSVRLKWPELHQLSKVTPHTFTRVLTSAVTSIVPA